MTYKNGDKVDVAIALPNRVDVHYEVELTDMSRRLGGRGEGWMAWTRPDSDRPPWDATGMTAKEAIDNFTAKYTEILTRGFKALQEGVDEADADAIDSYRQALADTAEQDAAKRFKDRPPIPPE